MSRSWLIAFVAVIQASSISTTSLSVKNSSDESVSSGQALLLPLAWASANSTNFVAAARLREPQAVLNRVIREKRWRGRSQSPRIPLATSAPADAFDAVDGADLSFVKKKRNSVREVKEGRCRSTATESNSIIAPLHDANVNAAALIPASQRNVPIALEKNIRSRKPRSTYIAEDVLPHKPRINTSALSQNPLSGLPGNDGYRNVTEDPYIKRKKLFDDKVNLRLSIGMKYGILQDAPYTQNDMTSQVEVDNRIGKEHKGGVLKRDASSAQPVWLVVPPKSVIFSNSSGGKLDCQIGGVAAPVHVSWLRENLAPVEPVPGLLSLPENGSLVFLAFNSHSYSPAIHASTYSCVSSFPQGAMLSLPVHVRAVVDVTYEAHVRDQHVVAGNTAVLTCELPSYVKDYVTVTSWLRDDAFNVFPSLRGDGKYHVTRDGVLRVLSVAAADTRAAFRCRTLSTLTAAAQLSAAARIVLTETISKSAPMPVGSSHNSGHFEFPQGGGAESDAIVAAVGADITLPCDAHANPPPTYTWYKNSVILQSQPNMWVVGGALVMTSLTPSDAGSYKCIVNNTEGSISLTSSLVVTSLSVQVVSSVGEVTPGSALELRCYVSGGVVTDITWYKDALQVSNDGHFVTSKRTSAGASVVDSVLRIETAEPRDAGVYQCRATSPYDVAQHHTFLKLGASAPVLVYRFIAHTLQPGPAVSLKCIARATPTPHITWTLDGFPLPQSHRFLMGQFVSSHGDVISHVNISSVRVADGGRYRCTARNSAGRASHSARLNVYGPPTVRHMGQLTAVAGETLSVTCPVGGHPVHRITWHKDGVELPLTHQQSVHANGTLAIAAVTRAADEGSYSCSAYDKQGRSDSQALQIQVIVPPRLAPVVFVGGTSAGLPAQATCIVLDGDPPISLRWLKDGHPIETTVTGVLISQHSEITSTLSIERTSAQHSGNYTCAASNAATTTYSSATLVINMPPTWVQEPSDVRVVQGAALELQCSATGVPRPSVVWRRQTSSGNWRSITSEDTSSMSHYDRSSMSVVGVTDRDLPLLLRKRSTAPGIMQVRGRDASARPLGRENLLQPAGEAQDSVGSSLNIVTATKEHQGRYSCEASNGVGAGLSKLITISVLAPPWFPSSAREVAVEVRGTAELRCRVRGDPPLTLHWRRAGHLLTLISSKYKIEEEKEGEDAVLKLILESAHATDSGEYECQASNTHGSNTQTHTLVVRDVPTPPSGLQLVQAMPRALTLEWSASSSDAAVTSYVVFYSTSDGPRNEMKVPSTMARVTGLTPDTRYLVRVAAENSVGRSALTDALAVSTLEEPPAGPPRNVKVMDVSARSVVLRWERPLKNLSNGAIRGYILGHRQNSFTQLGASMNYEYTAIPLQGAPKWTPSMTSPSTSMPARQADTKLSGSSSVSSVIVSNVRTMGTVTEMTVNGLRPHSRYALVLQAYNSEGTGPSSPAITIVTEEDVPSSPPQNVTCEAVSSSELLVMWSPPAAEGINGRIVSYTVSCELDEQRGLRRRKQFRPSGSRQSLEAGTAGCEVLVDDGLRARLASLKAFSNYSVTVAAATAVGSGVSSEPVLCTTAQGVPSAPASVKAVASGRDAAVVSWRPPDATNGLVTRYAVQWRAVDGDAGGGRREVLVPGDRLHTKLTDLPARAILEVAVRAQTAVGPGAPSKPVTISLTDTVPAGVWSVGGPVTVAWKESITLPCRAVGEPAPSRSWTRDSEALRQDSRMSVLKSGDVRFVDAQRSYSGSYTCTATNTHGSDSVTYLLRVIMPPSPPLLHVTETTTSSVRLQWTVQDDGGAPVTGATLYYRASGGATLEEQMTSDVHAVDNLRCGTLYHLFATVRNSIGSSESSEVVEARTKGRTPEPPPQFQFITSNSTQATLYLTQWEDGGCDITHFRVQYRKQHTAHWTTVSSEVGVVRTFAVGGLEPGQRYEVRVTAHNSAGATPALYTVATAPLLHSAGEQQLLDRNNGYWTDREDSSSRAVSAKDGTHWNDGGHRVLLPLLLSVTTLLLAAFSVCFFFHKRRATQRSDDGLKGYSPADPFTQKTDEDDKCAGIALHHSRQQYDPSCENVYHYVTSGYALNHSTGEVDTEREDRRPPPSTSPPAVKVIRGDPANVGGIQCTGPIEQKTFSSVLYQAPSLHEVDQASMSGAYTELGAIPATEADYIAAHNRRVRRPDESQERSHFMPVAQPLPRAPQKPRVKSRPRQSHRRSNHDHLNSYDKDETCDVYQ